MSDKFLRVFMMILFVWIIGLGIFSSGVYSQRMMEKASAKPAPSTMIEETTQPATTTSTAPTILGKRVDSITFREDGNVATTLFDGTIITAHFDGEVHPKIGGWKITATYDAETKSDKPMLMPTHTSTEP